MAEFSLVTERLGETFIVRPTGFLEKEAGLQVAEACRAPLATGIKTFLFNLAGSPVINSSGLSELFRVFTEILEKNEGTVVVCHLSTLVRTALRATGVLPLVTDIPTEAEALAYIDS